MTAGEVEPDAQAEQHDGDEPSEVLSPVELARQGQQPHADDDRCHVARLADSEGRDDSREAPEPDRDAGDRRQQDQDPTDGGQGGDQVRPKRAAPEFRYRRGHRLILPHRAVSAVPVTSVTTSHARFSKRFMRRPSVSAGTLLLGGCAHVVGQDPIGRDHQRWPSPGRAAARRCGGRDRLRPGGPADRFDRGAEPVRYDGARATECRRAGSTAGHGPVRRGDGPVPDIGRPGDRFEPSPGLAERRTQGSGRRRRCSGVGRLLATSATMRSR